ncbi:hypothetical protein GCM10027436_02990 [Actinophytocola sediminis]
MDRSTRRTAITVAVIGAIASVSAAIIAAPWWSSDTPEAAPTTGGPPAASASSSPPPGGSPRSGITAPVTASDQPEYGDPRTYPLRLSAGVYVDLDTGTATLDGGSDAEFFYKGDINKEIFFGKDANLYGRSKVALISHQDMSTEACEQSTRPQSQRVSGYFMEDDDVICLSTSEDAWAVLEVLEWGGTGGRSAAFDVTLWPVQGHRG